MKSAKSIVLDDSGISLASPDHSAMARGEKSKTKDKK